MVQQQGIKILHALRRRWMVSAFAFCLLLGGAVAVLVTRFFHWNLWVVFLVCFLGTALIFPYWRIVLRDVVLFLDRERPELEESCGLLLRDDLGPLEQLQVERIVTRLNALRMPRPFMRKLLIAVAVFCVAFVVPSRRESEVAMVAAGAPVLVAAVKGVTVTVTPPAYTGRVKRSQSGFSLQVEEGALLNWEVSTSASADSVCFIFNDTARMRLQSADRVQWGTSMVARQSGFYQVIVGGKVSELYKLEVIRDEPPKITIKSPKPYSLLEYGESTRIPLRVEVRDDYGVTESSVVATVASGKGEAVKFRQQELFRAGGDISRTLDLAALGLKPGDELYFYCRAKDNHGQETRSDMYIISLADTAQLMSLEGMTVASDVKPEFFRSERQIIIETEQLLKERDTLSVDAFHSRSNDMGIDQKLLRLRYGKFLGEEAEEGGHAEVDDKPGAFGDASKILDAYTDKHDNAEDATFFEPGIKAQLKATLSEMWKAELQLRTYKPSEALPFAYKALRLLKDLQQQSRTFVAKTGVKTTPLNLSKRLTGELGPVQEGRQRVSRPSGMTEEEVLRLVLGLLETGRFDSDASRVLMEEAVRRLGVAAASRPGEFLAGYQAMKGLAGGDRRNVVIVEKALKRLLPVAQQSPVVVNGAADEGLGKLYFSHIGKQCYLFF